MKSSKLIFGLAAIALSFTSCKNEKETEAQKTVDSYVVYVDSLEAATPADVKMNWESIDAAYNVKMNQEQLCGY
jgi:hypothetical protein